MASTTSLRVRKKEAIRQALLASAHRLFGDRGFEQVTIDEISEDVGVSRRTFFRYFPHKEALIFPNRDERLERFVAFLETAPAGESPFDTLRRATLVFAAEYTENRDQLVGQQSIINSSPSLQAKEREIDHDWEKEMEAAFVKNTDGGAPAILRARVLAGASMGVIRATMRVWFESGGTEDLARLGLEALSCLERGFPLDVAR